MAVVEMQKEPRSIKSVLFVAALIVPGSEVRIEVVDGLHGRHPGRYHMADVLGIA